MLVILPFLLLALTRYGYGQRNCSDDCTKALGMEDNKIKNSQIIVVLVYNDDYANFGSQNARLHNSLGYRGDPQVARVSNFLVINFDEEMVITAIATQGFGDPKVNEWVTSFQLLYKDSKGDQKSVKGTDGQALVFLGNMDGNTVKLNSLPIPVLTTVVTIIPLTANNNVGLRLELYGCKGGHYFVAWLMLKETLFTLAYTDPLNYEYEEATATVLDEIDRILGTSRGFLRARIIELTPQTSASMATMVTAMVEIHCLRSSEPVLLAKLKTALEEFETVFEPSYIKFQYPKRCGCTPLKAKIKLRKTIKTAEVHRRSQMLRFPVELENSCQSSGSKFYSWTVSKIDKETGLFGPLLKLGKKMWFFLPLRMIGVGYVYIQCLVEISGNTGSIAYDYGYVRVVRDPLEARIADISDSSSKIVLSGKESRDTGNRRSGTRGLRFAWFCRLGNETFSHEVELVVDRPLGRTKSNSGCLGFGPGRLTSTDEVLTLNITDMIKSEMYIFKLVIEKDVRNASAVYEFTVKPVVSISVRCLSNCGEKVTPQDYLLLEAHCVGDSCSRVSKYEWSVHLVNQEDLSVQEIHHKRIYPQMNSQRFLMEDVSELQDDRNKQVIYVVKAVAKLDVKTQFEGNFTFVVNSPPRKTPKTRCHVTPMEGEAVLTDFIISCSGWNDEDKPLIYEFRYQDKYGMVLIQTGRLNRVITKLPVGKATEDYSLVLEVQVGDSFKDFTETRLLVKVRPLKQSELKNGLVDKQLNVIRDLVQADDADRATELAFMLMSTVKDFSDESFEEKSSAIVHDIKDLKVNSVVHVTKVTAVVAWATEDRKTVPMSLRYFSRLRQLEDLSLADFGRLPEWLLLSADALTLLTEATDFMALQFTSNSTHDAQLAKNVSSGLLNSIGSILNISSRDAKVETRDSYVKENGKETTMKTMELIRKVGEVLYVTDDNRQNKTVVKSNFVDIVIYKEKPEDLSGKNISESGASVVIPDSKDVFPNANESVTIQMITFKENPYTWDKTALSIKSSVIDITLKGGAGFEVQINNLSQPFVLHIPYRETNRDLKAEKEKRPLFLQPGKFRYHALVIPTENHLVSLRIATVGDHQLAVYFGREFKPTVSNYTFVNNLPDLSSCNGNNSLRLTNCRDDIHALKLIGYPPGLYYVGIIRVPPAARFRRSCINNGRRPKRSCVQVKDPPTTPPPTPRIITMRYNATTDVNYTFSVNIAACLFWSEREERWSSKGCQVGRGSKPGRVHCLCNHLTSFGGEFFVAPNPIDFDKVWEEFGRLGATGNYAVLATVCSMLWFYFVGLVFARRADKRDELKVIAEFDLSSPQDGNHTYTISIQTGTWRNSGTTANVGLVLFGEESVSNPIFFAHQHLERIFFARGSVNTFTLSLEKSLGSLYKVNVWHDNSGKNPSWFLLEIIIEELRTKEKWHFVANRWLAVEKGLGEIELELRAASNEDLLQFRNVFHSRTQQAVGDSHLWFSLFTKPPHNQFTRCQRLSCCMSVIFCAMVTGAMFYRFGAQATDTFHLGPLKLSWTEIKIGIQSGLVAIPVNFLVVTIFRNSKYSGDQETSSGCLPHFCIYIGWVLCISAMFASAAFTVFYSLSWGAEISNQWLVSMTLSFFQDVLLVQPFKVLCIICLLSMVVRKPVNHEEVCQSQYQPEHHSVRTDELNQEARILKMDEIEVARRKRHREVKAFRAIVEIYFFIVFISLFMIVCYGNRDSLRYSVTKSAEDLFKGFAKVNNKSSLWNWVRSTFVRGLFDTRWYNGELFDYEEGFIANRENFLVGMPRLRQVRILPEMYCDVYNQVEGLVFPRCLPLYDTHEEDTTPYNKPGWIPVSNFSGFASSDDEINLLCPKPWQYMTADLLGTVPFKGKMATYGGGGYVANLGYNSESALAVINSLDENRWIDDKTAAVFIEFTVFDPSTSLFGVAKYVYERLLTGGVLTSSNVKAITVYLPHSSNSFRLFYLLSQALLMLIIVGFAIMEMVKAFRGGHSYFRQFWSWADMLLLFVSAAGIGIMFYKEKFMRDYVTNVRENPYDNWSTDHIVLWSEIEDYLLSVVIFLATIKSLRLIRFNHHIYQMRFTLRSSLTPLCSFMAIFLVVVVSFASFGLLYFGSSIDNYSSLPLAVGSLLQMLIGGRFSYYQLKFAADGFLGPLFLFLYLMTSMAVVLNTFVAILNESYSTSRIEKSKDIDDIDSVELAQYLMSCIKSWIGFCRSFYEFLKESMKCRRVFTPQKPVNEYHSVPSSKTSHLAPRLASMESLNEIETDLSKLSLVDDLLSNVQARLRRISEQTLLEESLYTLQTTSESKNSSEYKLDFESDSDSFLEVVGYPSSASSTLNFDDIFSFHGLSESDISETRL